MLYYKYYNINIKNLNSFILKTLSKLVFLTNIIITRLIKYMVAIVGNIIEGIININHKVIIEVFIEVYFKIIILLLLFVLFESNTVPFMGLYRL